uniref:Aggrecan core protein n=1 Tax=Oryzias latipes TaxID=8090 RepID=A0A3P9J0E1_ORYLA
MIRLTLLTSLSLSLVSAAFDYISEAHSFMDPEDVLSVDIPLEEPQRPLLGSSLVLPCFFQDHTVPDPGAPVIPPLSHRIKWSFVTKENVSTVLVALGGQVRIGKGYLDRVQLLNYPQTPEDASIRISELRSSDTGVYSCEVQLGIEDDHDFVQVYVTGVVFHYRSFMGRYALTFEEAKTTCSQNSAAIASPEQLQAAYDDGFHQCDAGWISDQTVRYPIHDVRVNCFGDKEDLPGVRNYGVRDPREKYDVYCFAEKMTGRVFFTTSVEKFTVSEAALACSRHGAQLSTTGQLYIAWQGGMDVCNTGWLADLSVRYPINVRRPQCGGGLLGVRTVYLHPNQTGFPLPQSRHGAFCYADSPDDKSLNSGSGSGDESGPWRVSTVTKDPQLLFSWVTSESEVVGEMETQASTALNVTNFENPKKFVSPTVIIAEPVEANNRPGVGKEPNTGSTMPPAGVIFHYRSHTGRYTFNFSEAQLACQSVGGSIASPQQLQAAYESGYHQCDAGWLLDQTVRYSIVVPRDKCAGDLGEQPGVRSYGMRPADERYDVYCYIEDLRGEVFHVESAEGLTYDQAVLSCQEHGGILASTGELYAAWKTGFDKCRAGWLQDGSVRYPINIPRARCGGGKHGVHTVYTHPNQTGFPPREDRYDAYCIRMNILLTANETGPNATDIHDKQLNHTSVADSFRLSLSSIVPSVHVEMSGSGSGAENTGPEFAGGCIFMNHCGELSGSDFGDQIISGDYTSSTGPPGGVVTNSSGSGLSGSRNTDRSGSSLSESNNMDGSGAGLSGSSNINGSRSGFNGTNHVDSLGSGLSGSTSMDGLESGLSGSNSTDDTGSGLSGSNSTDDTGSGLSGSNNTDNSGSGLSGSDRTADTGSGLSGSTRTDYPGSGLSGSNSTDDTGSGLSGSNSTDNTGSGLSGSNITDNSGSGLSGSDSTDDTGSGLSGSDRTDDPGSGLSGSNITENSGSSHSGFSSIDGSGSGYSGPSGVDNSGSGLSGLSSVDSSSLGLGGSNSTDNTGSGLSGSNSTDDTGSGLSGSDRTADTGSGLSGSTRTDYPGSGLSGSNSTDDTGSGLSGSNSTDNTGSGLSGSNITDNSGSGLSGSDSTDDTGSGLSGSDRTDDPGSGLSGSNITENSGSSHSGFSSIDGSGSGYSGPSGVDNSGSGLSGLSSVDSSSLGLGGSNSTDNTGSGLSGSNSTDDTGSGLSGSDRTDNSGSGLSGSDRTDDPGSGLSESNITENSGSGNSGFSSIDDSGSGFSGPSGVDNSGSGLSGLSSVDSSSLGLSGSNSIIAIGSDLSGYSNFDDSGSGLGGSSSTDGLESGLSGSSSVDGSGSTLNGGGYNIPVVLSKLESFALEGGSALSREVKEGRPAILFFPSSVEGSGEPSGSRNLPWSGPETGFASVDSGFSVESSGGSKALFGTTSGFILHQDFSGFKGFTSGSFSGSGSGQTREFEGSGNTQIFLIHNKLMDASVNQKQHELGGGPPVLSGSGDFSGSGILGGSFSDSDPESVSVLSSDVTSIGSGITEVSVSSAAEHKQASEILLHSSGQGGEIQLSGLRGSTFVSQSVSGFSRSDIPSNEDKVKNLFLREDPNRQRKSRERGSEDHSGDGSQSGNGDAIATTAFFLGETSGHKQAEATTKPEKVTEVPVDGSEHVPAGLEARLITAEPAFEETSRITEDLDVCHPNPCANGATCVDSADSFRCLCLPSYGGERCDVDEQHCAEGWTKFQGNCYLHVSKRETWPGAEQHCRSLNAHLVSIITPEEQQFVNANAKAHQWIGLNDRTVENDFHWTDCTPVQYQNWKQNQPDNYGSGENCVEMIWLKNGLWNDVPCHYHLPFTCKKGPVSCGEPPHVVNAVMFGRKKLEYPVRSIVRYQCNPGFRQRHSPVVRCQADGLWETPRVECVDAKARTRAEAGIIRRLPSATQGTARSS